MSKLTLTTLIITVLTLIFSSDSLSLFGLWIIAPLLLVLVAEKYGLSNGGRVAAWLMLVTHTSFHGILYYETHIISSTNSTSAIALLFIPAYAILAGVIGLASATVVNYLKNTQ